MYCIIYIYIHIHWTDQNEILSCSLIHPWVEKLHLAAHRTATFYVYYIYGLYTYHIILCASCIYRMIHQACSPLLILLILLITNLLKL